MFDLTEFRVQPEFQWNTNMGTPNSIEFLEGSSEFCYDDLFKLNQFSIWIYICSIHLGS